MHSTFFFVLLLLLPLFYSTLKKKRLSLFSRLRFGCAKALQMRIILYPEQVYGPTSCFFFTLNTLMYTVIICTHAYILIPRAFWNAKNIYLFNVHIYLLLDRAMIAYFLATHYLWTSENGCGYSTYGTHLDKRSRENQFSTKHLCIPLSSLKRSV